MTVQADVEDRGALVAPAAPARPWTAAGKVVGGLRLAARLARDPRCTSNSHGRATICFSCVG